jgi:diguanylate cyclase (GGDEF)-like protein
VYIVFIPKRDKEITSGAVLITALSRFCKILLGVLVLMPLVLILGYTQAHAAQSISLNHHQDSYSVTQPDFVITDLQQTLFATDPAINWQPYKDGESKIPFEDQALWLKFNVIVPATIDEQWVLAIRLTTLQRVQVYTFNTVTKEVWHSEPQGLMHSKPYNKKVSRYPVFNLSLSRGQVTTVLIKAVSPHILIMPIDIVKAEVFEANSNIDLLIIGAILGSMLIMFLYNMSLYSLLRTSSYFYYSAYVLATLFYLTSLTGIGPIYLWPHSSWLLEFGTVTFASLTFLFATLFVRNFLNLKAYGGIMLHATTLALIAWGVLSILMAFTANEKVFSVFGVVSLLTCIIALWISSVLTFKKVPAAIIFTLAWLVLIIGTMTFVLMRKGLLPINAFTVYSQMIGMVIELILLSFALALRINLDRKKREKAQRRAYLLEAKVNLEKNHRIKVQNESLELQRDHNLILENQVAKRTQLYEDAMGKLEVLNDELTSLTLTDTLTQIANRRRFDRSLEEECRRAYRDKNCLAIIFIDIDNFKLVNDTYGHGVGDTCIKTIATLLDKQAGRSGDLVARYGGEEFVYMLSNTSEQDACKLAEKARSNIESAYIETADGKINVTASFGVAAWIPNASDEYKLFVSTADNALYQAKEGGRNQVVSLSIGVPND